MIKAIGLPIVTPRRTPATMRTSSVSIGLAIAAAETQLAPPGLGVQGRDIEREPAGNSFDDADQGGAVGFAGGEVAQAHTDSASCGG